MAFDWICVEESPAKFFADKRDPENFSVVFEEELYFIGRTSRGPLVFARGEKDCL
jgi:hypothetical protein